MNIFNFIKNIAGTKVNPATEETLAGIKSQTDLLTFSSETAPSPLSVKVATKDLMWKNVALSNINPMTEESLVTVKNKTNNLLFDADSGLKTTGLAPTLDSSVNVKDLTTVAMSPAGNEKLVLLRQMVKLMESKGTVDVGNNRRIVVDGFAGSVLTGTGVSGDGVPLVTMASDYPTAITGVNTSTNYMGWNSQMFKDTARDSYARNIRKNLVFS